MFPLKRLKLNYLSVSSETTGFEILNVDVIIPHFFYPLVFFERLPPENKSLYEKVIGSSSRPTLIQSIKDVRKNLPFFDPPRPGVSEITDYPPPPQTSVFQDFLQFQLKFSMVMRSITVRSNNKKFRNIGDRFK